MIDTRESMTAKLCSFARAYHSNFSKHKIFDDYLAFDLMGKDEYEEIGQLIEHNFDAGLFDSTANFRSERISPILAQYISPIPLSRIAFAEKELAGFAAQYGTCQYIICGAGMDTFAFRNENSNIRVFELDHPDTQRYKLEKVKELEWIVPENVRYVSIDFSKQDMAAVLKNAGFDSKLPTFFAILGVTYYLTLPIFEETIRKITELSALSAASKIVFDFPDETTFSESSASRVRKLSELTAKLGENMLHGFSLEEIRHILGSHGFEIAAHETPDKIQKNYFKNRTDGQYAFENIHFITAVKKEKNRNPTIFASESVTKGHPDKASAYLAEVPLAHVAAETTSICGGSR